MRVLHRRMELTANREWVSLQISSYSTPGWQENRMFSGSPLGSQTPNIFPSSNKFPHKAGR